MAYVTCSPHITEKEEKAHYARLRRMGRALASKRAFILNDLAIREQRAGLAEEHPGWSEHEVNIHWAGIAYGDEMPNIETKLRARLGMAPYDGSACGPNCHELLHHVRNSK